MSFTKTNIEILKHNMIKSLQADSIKSRTQLPNKSSFNNNDKKKEFIYRVNIIDAKALDMVDFDEFQVAPKFRYGYTNDDYSFGMVEHFINNCDFRNINNITTIKNGWIDKWNSLYQYDIVVSSKEEDAEHMMAVFYKIHNAPKNRIYFVLPLGEDFIEEEILIQLQKHLNPKIDKHYLVNILESMGVCAKIDFIHREDKRFLAQTDDIFLEKVQMSLKELNEDEEMDVHEFFQRTYKYKRDTSFIKWVMLSWIITK